MIIAILSASGAISLGFGRYLTLGLTLGLDFGETLWPGVLVFLNVSGYYLRRALWMRYC